MSLIIPIGTPPHLQIMSCIVYNGPEPDGSPNLLPSSFALPKEEEVNHHVVSLPDIIPHQILMIHIYMPP